VDGPGPGHRDHLMRSHAPSVSRWTGDDLAASPVPLSCSALTSRVAGPGLENLTAPHGRDPAQAGAGLMAEPSPVEVTVEIDGQELVAGTLWVHERGKQSASFRYSDSYLTTPGTYSLDPVLNGRATDSASALFLRDNP
jgi:hypothetical protein